MEAARLQPAFAEVHIVLGNVLVARKRWDAAVEAMRGAVTLRPDILAAKANLALATYASGGVREAEALYSEIARLDPNNLDARSALAACLYDQRRFADAEPHARIAAKSSHGNAGAYNSFGSILLGLVGTRKRNRRISGRSQSTPV